MGRTRLAFLIFVLLAACTPTPTPELPPPVPRIATTPYFEPMVSSWIAGFAAEQTTIPFELVVLPAAEAQDALAHGDVDLLITTVAPSNGVFATPLRHEGIAIILHPTNKLRNFNLEDLDEIFSGRINNWELLGGPEESLTLYLPLQSEPLRVEFERLLSLKSITPTANLAPSPAAMLSLVQEDPGAIGLLPFSLVLEEVRVARVDDIILTNGAIQTRSYPLTIEIVATAPSEPEGHVREWLVWIQSVEME